MGLARDLRPGRASFLLLSGELSHGASLLLKVPKDEPTSPCQQVRKLMVHVSSPGSICRGLKPQPQTALETLVHSWHDAMGASQEVVFCHALKRLETLFPSKQIPKWSVFAGTGICTKVAHALVKVWKARYDVHIEVGGVLYCENNPAKQQWLRSQFQPQVLREANI